VSTWSLDHFIPYRTACNFPNFRFFFEKVLPGEYEIEASHAFWVLEKVMAINFCRSASLLFSPPASHRRDLQHDSFPGGISQKFTTKSHSVRKIRTE
jgi:hypothetical protein